jgi:hypothetical protein
MAVRLGFCAVLLALLPSCQVWNAWLDMLKIPVGGGKPATPALADKGGGDLGKGIGQAVVPRVEVFRITAPVGTFSTNEKVWTELNEDALDSKMSVLMSQNGLRAGTGLVSRWPAIVKLIEGPGVSSDTSVCQTDGRSSLNVVTRAGVTDEIVVSIDRDLQQQGRTFERCDNGFKLSMRPVRGKPQLLVQLEPYVTLGTVAVVRREGELGVTGSGFMSEEAFADLQMAATLSPDQFLVVCAVDPKAQKFSVGTLWLSDVDKVPAMETVLIFKPATAPGK